MRGRKPKPAEVRIREGNPGKRALPEPVLIGGRPSQDTMGDPPEHLSALAQEFWADTVSLLIEVGVLDHVDRPALEMLATQYARWRQASRVVNEMGHFARGSTGQLVEHPSLKIEREASAMFMRLAEQFGLSPVARVRLGTAELQRRNLAAELAAQLGPPKLEAVSGDSGG